MLRAPVLLSIFLTAPALAQDAAAESSVSAPAAEATQAATPASSNDGLPKLRVRGRRDSDSIFGDYRLRIAGGRPQFDDCSKCSDFYSKLYGSPAIYPSLTADWFAWDWYVTLGLRFSMGYYTDEGYAAKGVSNTETKDIEKDQIVQDKNGPTSMTLLPFQFGFVAEMTPFQKKWLVLDGWIGVERLYWQEVRSTAQASSKALIAEGDAEGDALTNKGWKGATVIGAAANILLNPLDEGAASSMRGTMGFGSIYLSPYVEIVRSRPKESQRVSFGRTTYGLGFTFETAH